MAEQITVTDPQFDEELRAIQTTDPAHPDTWNPQFLALLRNDHWLRASILQTQQQVEDILGSDPVQLSDQLDALVQYGAQRVFTERDLQVPTFTITSAVGGDDSIDLESSAGVQVGQHYAINDSGNVQVVRVAQVLSASRITLTTALISTVSAGSTLSRRAPGHYFTPELDGMERGGTLHSQGNVTGVQGWSGNAWQALVKRADGGYDIPAGVARLRVDGDPTRVAVISALPISVTWRSVNRQPADGATGMTTTPILQGAPYYPLYGVPQRRRQFQIIEHAGSFADPLYEAEEVPVDGTPVIEHTAADNLATNKTYEWRYRDQNVEGEWAPWSLPTTFSTANTYVATPSVTSPMDGATEVPEQPVIEASAFSVVNGSDTHAATSVRIKDDTGAVVWQLIESTTLDGITVPEGVLEEGGRTYTVEVRHHGATFGASAWSAPASFTTAASFVPDFETQIGAPYGGGYVAGKIVSDYDGQTYGLIVSDGGGDSVQMGAGAMAWRTAQSSVTTTHGVPPMTLADGRANHNAILALNNLASFPAFQWIEDNCNAGAGLNGHTDWYLPSRDELEVIYRNFKPTTQDNSTGTRTTSGFGGDGLTYGTNANSVPAGAGYTASDPAQTTEVSFQAGGPDAFVANYYWSSTELDASSAWSQNFNGGSQYRYSKTLSYRVRAVRRIAL
jgi:hypothetical protein